MVVTCAGSRRPGFKKNLPVLPFPCNFSGPLVSSPAWNSFSPLREEGGVKHQAASESELSGFYCSVIVHPVPSFQFSYENQSHSHFCDMTLGCFINVTTLSRSPTRDLAVKNPAQIRSTSDVAQHVRICLPSCSVELSQGSRAPCQRRRASVRTSERTRRNALASSGASRIWGWICRRVKSRRNFCHKFPFQQDFPGNI